jgi:hypothetical protein
MLDRGVAARTRSQFANVAQADKLLSTPYRFLAGGRTHGRQSVSRGTGRHREAAGAGVLERKERLAELLGERDRTTPCSSHIADNGKKGLRYDVRRRP